MVVSERAIIRHARTMLQQLAQRMALAGKRRIEREPSGIDEHERGGSEHGFVKLHHGTGVSATSPTATDPSTTAAITTSTSVRFALSVSGILPLCGRYSANAREKGRACDRAAFTPGAPVL